MFNSFNNAVDQRRKERNSSKDISMLKNISQQLKVL